MTMKKITVLFTLCLFALLFTVSCKKTAVYENDGHEHTYSNQWSYDNNYHWKKTTCSGSWDCGIRITQKGAHSAGAWIADSDTINSTGKISEKKECTVCGTKQTRNADYPVFEPVDSEGQGVKLKFYLPENTREINIYKAEENGRFFYYSRIFVWNNACFTEKEIEWTDPYVENGKNYYYYFNSSLNIDNTWKYSNNSDPVTVKSNGGKGVFLITNEPKGSFDIPSKTFTFTTLPVYSIANAKTVLNFNSANNSWWYKIADNTFEIQVNYPFGNNTQVQVVGISVQGNINSSWPYSGNGELFYRSMEGGIIVDEQSFTWKKPE